MMTDRQRVAGKTVILTGGRGDLGSATGLLLAEHGAVVASLDLAGAAPQVRHDAIREYDVDVTDERSVSVAVARVVSELGTPDVLVNAAGMVGRPAPSHEATVDEFDGLFNLNVKGVWLMTKHVVPLMIAAELGSIVNFSSIHGLTGGKSVPLYHATKYSMAYAYPTIHDVNRMKRDIFSKW